MKLNLNKVTCVLVDGVDPTLSARVLMHCASICDFKDCLLISFEDPKTFYDKRLIKINKLSYAQYNKFIIKQLNEYIDSDFCLIVQTDGFILNPKSWDDVFYDYDYIGAPWLGHPSDDLVGNGGFSLRSKKFLDECSKIDFEGQENEDHFICRIMRNHMLNKGLKYAPYNVANKFSVENLPYAGQFGFHGKHTMLINNWRIV